MANYSNIIYNILSNDAGVAALVGDRIYPVLAHQEAAFPFIVYRKKIDPDDVKGVVNKQDTLTIEISVVSKKLDEADNIQQVVRAALDNTTPGSLEGFTVGKIHFVTQDMELYDMDENLYIIPSSYKVKIKL